MSYFLNWFKLVDVPFWQINMYRTLDFCPDQPGSYQMYQSRKGRPCGFGQSLWSTNCPINFSFFWSAKRKLSHLRDHTIFVNSLEFFAIPTRLLKPIWLLEYAGFCHFKHKIDPYLYIN